MAHTKTTKKRIRQNERHRMINRGHKTKLRNLLKQFEKANLEKNAETCKALLPRALKLLDQSAASTLIHKNNAARHKSRLTRIVNSFAGE
ncbi:30S ribosomal protein S20 [bacterium]|nr:30S ribosomal protein S20 [bacterium]